MLAGGLEDAHGAEDVQSASRSGLATEIAHVDLGGEMEDDLGLRLPQMRPRGPGYRLP